VIRHDGDQDQKLWVAMAPVCQLASLDAATDSAKRHVEAGQGIRGDWSKRYLELSANPN
jgi:hypothetical protein